MKRLQIKRYVIFISCMTLIVCIPSCKKSVDTLIAEFSNQNNDAEVRATAIEILGKRGDISAVQPLIVALDDTNEAIRGNAVVALGEIGDTRAVAPLIIRLRDNCGGIRHEAALALEKLDWQPGDEKENIAYLVARCKFSECVRIGSAAVDSLIFALNSDADNEWISKEAALALGRIGDLRAVDPLLAVIMDEEYEVQLIDIRQSVASALGKLGDRKAIPALIPLLKIWSCGRNTSASLQRLGWQPSSIEDKVYFAIARRDTSVLMSMWEQAEGILLDDLNSNKQSTAENAICVLIGIGDSESIPLLIKTLSTNGNRTMAKIYLSCGRDELKSAAIAWGKEHKRYVSDMGESAPVRWNMW